MCIVIIIISVVSIIIIFLVILTAFITIYDSFILTYHHNPYYCVVFDLISCLLLTSFLSFHSLMLLFDLTLFLKNFPILYHMLQNLDPFVPLIGLAYHLRFC